MKLRQNVPLAEHTTLGVGGPAAYFCEPTTEEEVARAIAWADDRDLPLYVFGGGSNIIVSDDGVQGVVVKMALRGAKWDSGQALIDAGAGEPWDDLVAGAVQRGWAGIECLSGIPGLVGATVIQNVGAYGQEVGDTLRRVRVFDRKAGRARLLSRADCALGYRDSVFRSGSPGRFIVLRIQLALKARAAPVPSYGELAARLQGSRPPELSDVRREVLALRQAKCMLLDPGGPNGRSCGSFFLNPIVAPADLERVHQLLPASPVPQYPQPDGHIKLSAAWLIEHAGFTRGMRRGQVGLSTQHALAIVCMPGARAREVVALARDIRASVAERFAIVLEPEPAFWGFADAEPLGLGSGG